MNRDSFPTAVRQPFHRIKHHIVCRQLGNRPVSAMLHYPTRKSNKRRLNQRLQSATMGGILKTMGLNYKHTIIGTALALSVTAILACGGSAPAAQPAPTAPTATQAPAATATTAPVVARVDTPAPPTSTVVPTRILTPATAAPTSAPVTQPTAVEAVAQTVASPTAQPPQAPVNTPTATLPQPNTVATPISVPNPTVTPVPPTATATAVPTSTPEPTAAPSLQVGTNVSDLAPGFKLPSARSGEYALESFRGDKNVVLVFYRAFW